MCDETNRRFARFVDRLEAMSRTGSKPQPGLRTVTADNAHEFTQAPKRRGRKPKLQVGGNVVVFRQPQANPAPDGAQEIGAALRKCLGRVDAILAKVSAVKSESAPVHAAVKPPRKQKPKTAPLPPAEDDADARLRSFFDRINALPIVAMSDTGKDPKGTA